MIQYTESSAAIAAPPQRRRRPALSCVQCRRRKIRCDQKRPSCSQCEKSKDIVCTYKPDSSYALPQNDPRSQATSNNPSQLNPPHSFEKVFRLPIPNLPISTNSIKEGTRNAGQPPTSQSKTADRRSSLAGNVVFDHRPLNAKFTKGELWSHMLYSPELERHVVASTAIFPESKEEKASSFKMKLIGETHWMNLVSAVRFPIYVGSGFAVTDK